MKAFKQHRDKLSPFIHLANNLYYTLKYKSTSKIPITSLIVYNTNAKNIKFFTTTLPTRSKIELTNT